MLTNGVNKWYYKGKLNLPCDLHTTKGDTIMKRKGLYVLATAAMLALAAGCGTNQGEENPQNQVTEAVSPTESPEATATPEPTATPAPTATPVPANYMEANGIEVLGAGWHSYTGYISREQDEAGNMILDLGEYECRFEVTEEDNGDGTKTIDATSYVMPYVYEDGFWVYAVMGGFVDLESGKAFLPTAPDMEQTTVLKQGEKNYELRLSYSIQKASSTNPYYTQRYTLICPSDYEDAGFYLTGFDMTDEPYTERMGLWKKLNFIRHGESDMVVFGVNEGLATEPEKKTADGAEFAEENYFEVNGLTTKGEGEYTWRGAEAIRKMNAETGAVETVSVEIKDITSAFSVEEESLGDGTKRIKGTFTYVAEMISEMEVKVPNATCGIVDKKTGLVYPPRAYNLAEQYVVEKDGEEFSISVGAEISEEEIGDGKLGVTLSFILICPEDYNDAVFYVTCSDEITEEDSTDSNKAEVFLLSEMDHGECELLFFR